MLQSNIRSAIRPKRNKNAREKRLLDLQEDYQIPLKWAEKLPVKERRWTDCLCLILFLVVCVTMIATTIYIMRGSDHDAMFRLYDSSGSDCGTGAVKDFPLLYMQNFKKPFKSVCVKECPRFDYNQMKYNADGSFEKIVLDDGSRLLEETTSAEKPTSTEEPKADPKEDPPLDKDGKIVPMYFKEFNLKHAGKSVIHTRTPSDEEIFGYDQYFANGYFSKQNFDDYLENQTHVKCSPNKQFDSCKYSKNQFWVYDSYPVLGILCAPLSPKTSLFFFRISSKINHGAIGDVLVSKWVFVYVSLISLAVAFIFLILTRFCGKWIVIILAIVTTLALMAFGIIVILNYAMPERFGHSTAHLHIRYQSFLKRYKVLLLILASCAILGSLIICCILCKFRTELSLAYPILEIAAKCSISNLLLILLSIFTVVLQLTVIIFEIYLLLRLYTMGKEINDKESGSPFVSFETGQQLYWLGALHIFGTYWIVIFLNNFNDFINAAITVNYYFKTELKNLNIFCHTLGHNCGSVAWTIVLLPVLIIKLIFAPFKWLITSEEPNKCQNCCQNSCNCCCSCYESAIDCVSENFMPLTYMGSENFNVATRRHFYLTELYLDESSTVSVLGFLYNLLGRIIITAFGGYCGVLIIQHNDELMQNVKYMGLIFSICFIISFILGSLMINIFSTAYETLFLCFLTEKNIYDQKKAQGIEYDLQARDDIEEAFLKIINDSNDYQKLNES